jgi:hypothetical protein
MRSSLFALALSAAALVSSTPLTERNNDKGSSYGGKGNAGYTPRVGPSSAKCSRQYYDITVTSENTLFENVYSNANETYLTSLLSKFVAQLPASAGNFTEEFTAANKKSVTGTYTISGTLCTPTEGDKDDGAIQLLVHGLVAFPRASQNHIDIALLPELALTVHTGTLLQLD